ncbi:hypothetical protein [Rhodococcus chondri]|uniref:Uncharacterized protein n=1 Tax=Rhodococcus chondri TaxID=3065941 RepID=A0ABU7JV21_9NOCA|nr:hypothetical protein [Rhodococcus sp. CC-R104]MEE2033873.1 hypothetical protein [Rhodococcus sp. CC-R104]
MPRPSETPQDIPAPPGVLADAALGTSPGLHPLPAARSGEEQWLRAVALGGQGYYSAARAELARFRRVTGPDGAWASLAASTEASLWRQLGRHRQAATFDGRALALAAGARTGRNVAAHDVATIRRLSEAECDALTGLAADALGCGRLALSRRLLDRCAYRLSESERPGSDGVPMLRQRIRHAWVTAETALASGDFESACSAAARAAEDARAYGSVRHQVKSDLLRAAALTGDADPAPALALAGEVADRAAYHGLVPLRWAAAMLVTGLTQDEGATAVRDECAALVRHRGGLLTTIRP